ncbi:MAG: efflux RND transporter periplasmic adaptor subunit [bacterium]|nr:efflux RND transporter periplasmic adaptor subunit [bacterium]
MFRSIFFKARQRKLITAVIIATVAGISYFGYQKYGVPAPPTRYVVGAVEKGSIIVSISGSGQVSSSSQVDVKPKVSGDVTVIAVKNGQEVNAGALLVQLDSADALKAVRDAKTSLESAQLSLTKLQKPADALSTLQSENSLSQAIEAKQKSLDDLAKAYEDGFNTVSNAFLGLPAIMTGLDNMLFDNTIDQAQSNLYWYANQGMNWDSKSLIYKDEVDAHYALARTSYNASVASYRTVTRSSDVETIRTVILQTYETTKVIADAVKRTNNFVDFVQDLIEQRDGNMPAIVATHQTALDSYTGTTNTYLLNLLAIKRTIEDSKNTIVNADRTIEEKTESLAKLKAGTEPLDIKSQELTVKQRQIALSDAREKLSDYSIRAPFSGIAANMNLKRGDPVSSATVLAVLLAKQQMGEISLNEVDVAKIKNGQKATVTFDALPEVSIAGQVVEIDDLGTVSQGVVTYNVKISFDTQDTRVKPGMSVSASIITEEKTAVLRVPNSALKTQGQRQYVEIVEDQDSEQVTGNRFIGGVILKNPARRRAVEIGIANDEFTEIIEGLKEGDRIVVRTIQSGASGAQTQPQSNSVRIPGLPTGGGGGFRGTR